jgi:tetratricopeptide (TPR) repeat protein
MTTEEAPSSRLHDDAGKGRAWSVLVGVGVLALAVRLVYLWQIHQAPFFDLRMGDGHVYHLWARRIAGGNLLGDHVFYQAPLYPYFLALVYRLLDDSAMTVRLVQALMGAASCILLAQAGRSLFGARGALVAGVGLALYPPAIFLDGLIQKSALGTLLTTALLVLLCAQAVRVTASRWLGAGVVLGLLALTRENALVFAVLTLVWLMLGHANESWRRRFAWTGLLLAGMGLILLPVGVRNRVVAGEFHLTTSQLGPNFYIGNHAGADGSYRPLSFGRGDAVREREDATRLAERAVGRELRPAEVSRFWLTQSLTYIRSQPADWLRLMARKLALTFNAAELADTESQLVFAEWSRLLRGLGFLHFGVLLPGAVFGAVMTARSWRRLWLVYLLAGGYAASVVLFYVFARYRFPLVPLLMLLVAGGAVEALDQLRRRRYRRPTVAAVAALSAAVFANLPLYSAEHGRAVHYFNVGIKLYDDPEQVEPAIDFFERALAIAPGYPEALAGLGGALIRNGQPERAVPHYLEAVTLRPDYADAQYGLGLALARLGRLDEATTHYRRALELRPDDAETHVALGAAMTDLGRQERAIEHHRGALAIQPDHVEAHVGLGVALTRLGRLDEAVAHYERALRVDPRHAVAHNNLGSALAMQGRIAEAARYFARAVALEPGYDEARRNLDQANRILTGAERPEP